MYCFLLSDPCAQNSVLLQLSVQSRCPLLKHVSFFLQLLCGDSTVSIAVQMLLHRLQLHRHTQQVLTQSLKSETICLFVSF